MILHRLLSAALLFLMLGHAPVGAATDLPAYYPESYEIIGTLIGVNRQEGYIVINDFALPLVSEPQVYTRATQFETIRHLRPGMTVGVGVRQHRGEPVSEIWVLPEDY